MFDTFSNVVIDDLEFWKVIARLNGRVSDYAYGKRFEQILELKT
jgi:hypothetical protein